jgi:hypothetical protein
MVFIELSSRRVHLAGLSENPSGAWVTNKRGILPGRSLRASASPGPIKTPKPSHCRAFQKWS